MSAIEDLLAESNDRWSRAMGKTQGVEDLGLGPAVKKYYTRYLPGGILVLIVSGTWVGSLIFDAAPSSWAAYLSFGFLFAMAGAGIGGGWSTTPKGSRQLYDSTLSTCCSLWRATSERA